MYRPSGAPVHDDVDEFTLRRRRIGAIGEDSDPVANARAPELRHREADLDGLGEGQRRRVCAAGLDHQRDGVAARDHYAELAPIVVPECEPEGSQARVALLIDRLDQLVRESGIAPRLRDYGIDIGEAPLLAREAMKQTRLLVNNPCEITEADARRLYEAAW